LSSAGVCSLNPTAEKYNMLHTYTNPGTRKGAGGFWCGKIVYSFNLYCWL